MLSLLRNIVSNRTGLGLIESTRSFSTSTVLETKLKTHKGTAKRWKAISNGSFKRGQAGKQHLNSSFPSWRISRLGRTVYSTATQTRTLKRLVPYA
ncbi:hypothetical protein HD553DRAFT_306736 [Filobasidium floriforme]|uniref:uncharacterized protein n=1 Tax=Filobasidium floriforme TaxID=5210 RepID=UPI001E8D99DB|nr:uncharacterized protein HD553DRAFT_306736 [Filobasidium floriforme]KAH8088577.1 hypothetical protein HD553DRAFT_306736 [Filobasidium floriforme]